ncbi:MAG: hypothetical protein HF973_06360 [Chloroflexi bacterium]|nr:hypothetical protein [Chloroflexota bacterium]
MSSTKRNWPLLYSFIVFIVLASLDNAAAGVLPPFTNYLQNSTLLSKPWKTSFFIVGLANCQKKRRQEKNTGKAG